jgi:hypothetical protein
MGHYARVVHDIDPTKKIVAQVIVADAATMELIKREGDTWIKTSYNTRGGIHYQPNTDIPSKDQSKALRKNFAGVNCVYDEERDAFMSRQPFDSWILNEDTCWWEPPVAYPKDGNKYLWNEDTLSWDEIIIDK